MSVIPLVICLCGVCASVKLKVQLSVPGHQLGSFFNLLLECGEEVIDRATYFDARQKAGLVAYTSTTSKLLEMLPGRSSTAVALSKWQQ